MNQAELRLLHAEVGTELRKHILNFWATQTLDHQNGGFVGYISDQMKADVAHPKSVVLNSRILWTFAAAYRRFRSPEYLTLARRAYAYLVEYFWDAEYSGVYWMVDYRGAVLQGKKQSYALAFAIYGLAEYHQATGDPESLQRAIALYQTLEKYFYDRVQRGYIEALGRDWTPIADTALGYGEPNVQKTMNSHLHILECYTSLYRIWPDPELKIKLQELLLLMLETIVDSPTCHFKLFFDAAWNSTSNQISYGHDIEGSWLLVEAAEVLNDAAILTRVRDTAIRMAEAVLRTGFDTEHGGIFNEGIPGQVRDTNKDWWPQAEAVVGFCNAYQLSGNTAFMAAALQTWKFIDRYVIDKTNGEWFREVTAAGNPIAGHEKVGPWKCPYHNSRMCLEMLRRLEGMLALHVE